jgi:hypothetical protein
MSNKEPLEVSGVPDSVRRSVRVLLIVADREVPSIQAAECDDFIINIHDQEHPLGDLWRASWDVATEEFDSVRLGRTCLDPTDSNDCVHFHAYHPSGMRNRATCSVAFFVDGTTSIKAKYDAAQSDSLQTFVKLGRDETLTRSYLYSAVEATAGNQEQS